jgi:predicted transcriptional regulator
MRTKALTEVMRRAENWPAEAQDELAEIAREIDAGLGGVYHATSEELAGIDRGVREADAGMFASEQEVEATFARYRRK